MADLQLHSAAISFGEKEVLKEVSFSLKTGKILGIFGRHGCGKSTLLKMIFGTLKKVQSIFQLIVKTLILQEIFPQSVSLTYLNIPLYLRTLRFGI